MAGDLQPYEDLHLVRKRLHVQIAEKIQDLIAAERLQPGDRLPPERELAETMDVSRPTVREALRLLEQWGLVAIRPGSGTRVVSLDTEPVAKSLQRFVQVKDCSFDDMMRVRELLEPEAAAEAAVHASSDEIEVLKQRLGALEEAFQSGDPAMLALTESQFHTSMANASGNPLLAALAVSIADILLTWTERTAALRFDKDSHDSHRAIVEAITNRDPDCARQACMFHMQLSRRARAAGMEGAAALSGAA